MTIVGDANDYLGKGLSGGKIVVKAPENAGYEAEDNIIAGNVALYGATSGEAYIAGKAGERFCVRNSGAKVVVEGVGDHGCEYMTGGVAVVLGPVGKNFAAGMSGGIVYVLDENNDLYTKLNKATLGFEHISSDEDNKALTALIREHFERTGSPLAEKILNNIESYIPKFKKVIPHDYKRMILSISKHMADGMSEDQAKIEAFHENTAAKA